VKCWIFYNLFVAAEGLARDKTKKSTHGMLDISW